MPAYTTEDAELLIKSTRNCIELQIRSPKFRPEMIEEQLQKYDSKAKIQVRLLHHPTGTLRASYTAEGILAKLILSAASSLAMGGAGQASLSLNELGELLIEISIFDDQTEISGSLVQKRKAIELGKDGIMVEYGLYKSMLMPSYATQKGLNKTQFLEAACVSAGLDKDYWRQPKVRIYKFEAQRFIETSPNGRVASG